MSGFGYDVRDWRVRVSIYFAKVMMGLAAFPFLIFKLPMIKDALVHTQKTGYDRAGNVVPLLSGREIANRFDAELRQRLERQCLRKNGYPVKDATVGTRIEDWWNEVYDSGQPPDRHCLTARQERALLRDARRAATSTVSRRHNGVAATNGASKAAEMV